MDIIFVRLFVEISKSKDTWNRFDFIQFFFASSLTISLFPSFAYVKSFGYACGHEVRRHAHYSGPYLCHVVSRALGNIYAGVTVRLPVKGFLNASISRRGAKRAWIFETDIHLRLLCYLAGTIAERTFISYYYFFQPDFMTHWHRFPAFKISFSLSSKFGETLKRDKDGIKRTQTRTRNRLAFVIDSYVYGYVVSREGEFASRAICFLFMDNLTRLLPLHRHQLCSQFGIMLHVFGSRSTICQYKGVTRGSLHTNSRAEQLVILNTRNPLETPGPPLPYLLP